MSKHYTEIKTRKGKDTTLSAWVEGSPGLMRIVVDDIDYGHIRVYCDEIDNLITVLQELRKHV